jgi:hypothetical protein
MLRHGTLIIRKNKIQFIDILNSIWYSYWRCSNIETNQISITWCNFVQTQPKLILPLILFFISIIYLFLIYSIRNIFMHPWSIVKDIRLNYTFGPYVYFRFQFGPLRLKSFNLAKIYSSRRINKFNLWIHEEFNKLGS